MRLGLVCLGLGLSSSSSGSRSSSSLARLVIWRVVLAADEEEVEEVFAGGSLTEAGVVVVALGPCAIVLDELACCPGVTVSLARELGLAAVTVEAAVEAGMILVAWVGSTVVLVARVVACAGMPVVGTVAAGSTRLRVDGEFLLDVGCSSVRVRFLEAPVSLIGSWG